jgi:anti-anti-sigma factor
MKVKIDTKERFTVIIPEETDLPANMTEEIQRTLLSYLDKTTKNIIINLENVNKIDLLVASVLRDTQEQFCISNTSMVVCQLQPGVETFLREKEILPFLNVTPTESEAWDIVQMEEIEREFG